MQLTLSLIFYCISHLTEKRGFCYREFLAILFNKASLIAPQSSIINLPPACKRNYSFLYSLLSEVNHEENYQVNIKYGFYSDIFLEGNSRNKTITSNSFAICKGWKCFHKFLQGLDCKNL